MQSFKSFIVSNTAGSIKDGKGQILPYKMSHEDWNRDQGVEQLKRKPSGDGEVGENEMEIQS